MFVTYWSFRAMIGLMAIPVLFALATLWLTRGGRTPDQRWFSWLALLTIPTPFLAGIAGWVFTEMGRQPWIVAPNPTGDHAGPAHRRRSRLRPRVWDGHHLLVTFTLVYAVLAVIWFWLLKRYVAEGPQEHDAEPAAPQAPSDDEVAPLSFAY